MDISEYSAVRQLTHLTYLFQQQNIVLDLGSDFIASPDMLCDE